MAYTKTNWTNGDGEPINANNLNKIENELATLDSNLETTTSIANTNKTDIDNIKTKRIAIATELLDNEITDTTVNALNDDKDNYEYLEIFFTMRDNEGKEVSSSKKIKVITSTSLVPQQNIFIENFGWWYTTNTQIALQPFNIYIQGRNITFGNRHRLLVATNGTTNTNQNIGVTITSILGINYVNITQ